MFSSHSIHTIHGTFSGISSYSRPSSHSPYAPNAGVVINIPTSFDTFPPGLEKVAWRAAQLSFPSRRQQQQPPYDTRRQPPLRTSTAQPVPFPHEDPFLDIHAVPVHASTQSSDVTLPPARTRLASHSFTVKLPKPHSMEALVRQRTAQRLAQDRELRLKAVAGILLNRVHAVGKPMRRPPPSCLDMPRTYKRSRLSTMISVDDL
ncbi:hypothetical protein F5I97DRAFT_641228 [Phlebopus sp. FC_14]|nr:hypothetical protein F5I97DRAFT_641228 [Phlebopus sp. FC_14]